MDASSFRTTGKPPPPPQQQPSQPSPRKPLQIQGPRPSALKLHQESHKIKKPPLPPPRQQPVIIYAVSPKVIHAEESNFKFVVQRLTGLSSGDFSDDGAVSPAARLAATERASPRDQPTRPDHHLVGDGITNDDIMEMIKEMDFGQIQGILSPAPAMLPPVAPNGFFSPVPTDTNSLSFLNDNYTMSPLFMASPSAAGFFPGPTIVSPVHSPDLFSLFMDF